MRKIDIHAHTTNRPMRSTGENYATLDILSQEMKKFDVEKTVLLATYFPHRSSGVSNYRLLNWANGRNEFLIFGSLDFEHYFYQGFNELSELAESGKIKGIKIYTCYQNVDLKGDKVERVIGLAKKNMFPVMFHTGYSYSSMRTLGKPSVSEMVRASDLEFLAKSHPYVPFIFSHMSKPFFADMIKVAKANDNVYTDMSGLIASHHEKDRADIPEDVEKVREFLEKAGPEKMLFGTDFPVQTHEDSVYFVEEAMKGFKDKHREDVYYNNARRLLQI